MKRLLLWIVLLPCLCARAAPIDIRLDNQDSTTNTAAAIPADLSFYADSFDESLFSDDRDSQLIPGIAGFDEANSLGDSAGAASPQPDSLGGSEPPTPAMAVVGLTFLSALSLLMLSCCFRTEKRTVRRAPVRTRAAKAGR